ncbi:MFS transporter [Microvirga aerilata]|uniref:MFS transporter n=1 Tax=Microvirga aerilata TaxID=670292 RepID=UPI0035E40295
MALRGHQLTSNDSTAKHQGLSVPACCYLHEIPVYSGAAERRRGGGSLICLLNRLLVGGYRFPHSESHARPSPFSPLRHGALRAVWLAFLIANLGGLIQSIGAAWLMTSLIAQVFTITVSAVLAKCTYFGLIPPGAC